MKRTLYLLIGPKGAGKSHIGALVNRHTAIHFLSVEPIWLSLRPGEDGWKRVESAIDALFQTQAAVMIESLGAGAGFQTFYASLAQKYPLKLIRVMADPDTCLARVKSRRSADHLPVSDDQVVEYNKIAANVSYPWDLEIDNNQPLSDAAIVRAILSLSEAADGD